MKYIDNLDISQFNSIIESIDVGPYRISGRIEAFNVKKHSLLLKREIDQRYSHRKPVNIPKVKEEDVKEESTKCSPQSTSKQTRKSHSAPQHLQSDYPQFSPAASPFGPLTHERSRLVFCDLIQCLNLCYPDYEFKNVEPSHFSKERSCQTVMNQINVSLRDAFTPEDRLAMWTLLSSVTDIHKCQVYSYHPDDEEDPLGVGNGKIWSWTYFFLNSREKKLIMFTCHARSKHSALDEIMSETDSDYDAQSNAKNVDFYYPNVNKWDTNTSRASFDDSDDDMLFEDDW